MQAEGNEGENGLASSVSHGTPIPIGNATAKKCEFFATVSRHSEP